MAGQTWELHDPVVSEWNFSPGLAVVRHELIEHGTLLWSSLRGLGMPVLGNEIQAAPLFPLTWLLSFVPEREYWNVFVLARFALAGLAALLLARERMRLDGPAAVLFVLCLVYALNVIRWMSHPWSNGFASGLWYAYGLDRLLETSAEAWGVRRLASVLLVATAAYGLVTCGFPEGAALGAVLALLVHGTRLVTVAVQRRLGFVHYVVDVLAAHAIGLAVSSPQTFAMVEFIQTNRETLQGGWRGSNGLVQYDAVPDLRAMISLFSGPHTAETQHLLGVVPFSLFASGVLLLALRPRRARPWDAVALVVALFCALKFFPLWPAFNEVVGRLPVLRQSLFIQYFQPLFLWVFAYFAARALAWPDPEDGAGAARETAAVCGGALLAAWLAWPEKLPDCPDPSATGILCLPGTHLVMAGLVLATVLRLLALHRGRIGRPGWRRPLLAGVLVLAAGEIWINRPHWFADLADYRARTGPDAEGAAVVSFAEFRQMPLAEVRYLEPAGRNASRGLATPDDGAPAVVPARNMLLRTTLFEVEWEGLLPLGAPKFPHSLRLLSVNTFNGWVGPEQWFAGDLLSIKAPVDDKGRVDFDTRSLPRAWLASACAPSAGPAASAAALADTRFALGTAWVEEMDGAERATCGRVTGGSLPRRVAIEEDSGTRVVLAAVDGPAVLVLNDTYYPGWHARDGRAGTALAIRPANLAFRAVVLPERRRYEVVFHYRPAWLTVSLALVVAGLLAAGGLLFSVRHALAEEP